MNWLKKLIGKERIFLDHAGGEMNPSGIHQEGLTARKRLEEARVKIAEILHCQARDVVFTSGGTESDNLAILGVFEAAKGKIPKPHIIISDHEHPAVVESAKEVERRGAELSIVPVSKIISNIKPNTILVSCVYVNNETGAINGVPKLAREAKDYRKKNSSIYPYIHTDATQALGYLPTDVERLGVDLLTLGEALVVRPRVELHPILFGGGQERGLRAGTQNIFRAEAFANELLQTEESRERDTERLKKFQRFFIDELEKIPGIVINTPKDSIPSIVSVSFPGQLHEFLAIKLDELGVAVSTGSSCDSSKDEKDKEALRFSWSEKVEEAELREAIRILREIVL